MRKILFSIGLVFAFANYVDAKSSTLGNTQNGLQTNFVGYSNDYPLFIRTDNVDRMWINTSGTSTINGSTVNTTGYIGINTDVPRSYLTH